MSGYRITLAGQDITSTVQESTIQIKDTLGQGAGVPAGMTGRAATGQFLTTLGPAASAVGAGTVIHSPKLVRMGEIQIFDRNNRVIFGGYASKIEDMTIRTRPYTQIDLYDYWQHLDRIMIQEVFSGVSDAYMVNYLIGKYAPWINKSQLPKNGSYTFSVKVFKGISLQKALTQITDITGFQIWIGFDKVAHYESPSQAQTAPFSLSTNPDNRTSFAWGVQQYTVDDTAVINKVTFYGGKVPSADFTQDLSTQANGNNTTFVLAYYPRTASDGKFHVIATSISGFELVVGYTGGTTVKDKLKSAGGICDVVVNADAHTLTFDIAPQNLGINSVTCKYRYENQLTIQVADQKSFNSFGAWYEGVISDTTVFDQLTAVARCRTLLQEQSYGLTSVQFICYRPGLKAGQTVKLFHQVRGINSSYIIQEVDTAPLGGGNFSFTVTAGAWRHNIVDVILQNAHAAQFALMQNATNITDTTDWTQSSQLIQVEQMLENVSVHEVWTLTTSTYGQFYARSSPVGDGHDAYPGHFTINS